jgi:hypothetical protein
MRRRVRTGGFLLIAAATAFLPAGWIVMMPADTALRPDLHRTGAWIIIALCVVTALIGMRGSARARAAFESEMETRLLALREKAAAATLDLDIEVPDTYPPVLLSRRFRKIGFAGPDAVILPMDPVEVSAAPGGENDMKQAHVVLKFPGAEPEFVFVTPGETETSFAQAEILAEKLSDYLDPRVDWSRAEGPAIDIAAFLDSMRPK